MIVQKGNMKISLIFFLFFSLWPFDSQSQSEPSNVIMSVKNLPRNVRRYVKRDLDVNFKRKCALGLDVRISHRIGRVFRFAFEDSEQYLIYYKWCGKTESNVCIIIKVTNEEIAYLRSIVVDAESPKDLLEKFRHGYFIEVPRESI